LVSPIYHPFYDACGDVCDDDAYASSFYLFELMIMVHQSFFYHLSLIFHPL
jgi:hypothetical protein